MEPNRFAIPQSEYQVPGQEVSQGRRIGRWTLGLIATVEGLGLAAIVYLTQRAQGQVSAGNLGLMAFVFIGLVALPGWILGSFLGVKLERSRFWRGLGWCVLVAVAWGIGMMAMLLLAGSTVNAYQHQMENVVNLWRINKETLEIQGILLLLTGCSTLLAGAIAGVILMVKRRN